jgi:hypothetical protein
MLGVWGGGGGVVAFRRGVGWQLGCWMLGWEARGCPGPRWVRGERGTQQTPQPLVLPHTRTASHSTAKSPLSPYPPLRPTLPVAADIVGVQPEKVAEAWEGDPFIWAARFNHHGQGEFMGGA